MTLQPSPRSTFLPRCGFGIGLLFLSLRASASFSGPLHLGFGGMFLVAFIAATPGAVILLFAEKFGAHRKPWPWLGATAIVVAILAAVLAHGSDPSHREPFFLLLIPPAGGIALITFVRNAPVRLLIALGLTLGGVLLGYAGLRGDFPATVRDPGELLGMLCGGAVTSLLFWLIGFHLGRRTPASELATDD
jgi:hypothetical protein